jgi:membrane peptidoglycan carboxypeptidase
VRAKGGKQLGGKPPRQKRVWRQRRRGHAEGRGRSYELIAVLALGLFVIGGVAGFTWAMDRQIRGGILRQKAEATQRADWVPLETLPAYVPNAFVGVVDPAFMEARALRKGKDGPTLARQLVRQVHLLPANLAGEAQELVMGPVLEHRVSKPALVELFLNRVHLGEDRGYPIYGLHYAAQEYFAKVPQQLTLSEAATLAGFLLEPRIMDPQDRIGALGPRRNEVLRVMLQKGLISAEGYQQAIREPLAFQPGLRDRPMTRPAEWPGEAPVIRLPEALRPRPDTLESQ